MNNTLYASTYNSEHRSQDYRFNNARSEERIRRNKLRRQRIFRRQFALLLFVITLFIIFGVFLGTTLMTGAQSDDYVPEFKYYTTVTVHEGDTVTKLATKYYSDNHYSNFNNYVFEICSINRLGEKDNIKAGENIIIPYYSTEFK